MQPHGRTGAGPSASLLPSCCLVFPSTGGVFLTIGLQRPTFLCLSHCSSSSASLSFFSLPLALFLSSVAVAVGPGTDARRSASAGGGPSAWVSAVLFAVRARPLSFGTCVVVHHPLAPRVWCASAVTMCVGRRSVLFAGKRQACCCFHFPHGRPRRARGSLSPSLWLFLFCFNEDLCCAPLQRAGWPSVTRGFCVM